MDISAAQLILALEAFVASTDRLGVLYESFYFPYFDETEASQTAEPMLEFFDEVAERMDFTADKPDRASRRNGYKSTEEFRVWLRDRLRGALATRGV